MCILLLHKSLCYAYKQGFRKIKHSLNQFLCDRLIQFLGRKCVTWLSSGEIVLDIFEPRHWLFIFLFCFSEFIICQCSMRMIADHSSRGVLPTVARRFMWSRNLENEEAKARYRAVKIQQQWFVTPGKQTNSMGLLFFISGEIAARLSNWLISNCVLSGSLNAFIHTLHTRILQQRNCTCYS
jgi:hypothetical protein